MKLPVAGITKIVYKGPKTLDDTGEAILTLRIKDPAHELIAQLVQFASDLPATWGINSVARRMKTELNGQKSAGR